MMQGATGRMMLFFGARRPEELPYFGPLGFQVVPPGRIQMPGPVDARRVMFLAFDSEPVLTGEVKAAPRGP